MLARPCYRALDVLVDESRIVDQSVASTRCFFHPWEEREMQVTERQSESVEDISPWDDAGDDKYLYIAEILEVMHESAAESVESIPPPRAATFVLRKLHADTFRAVERRVRHTDRLHEPLGYADPTVVPGSTTIWRAQDGVGPDEPREWLQAMYGEMLAGAEQSGRYAVVDATDIYAWANTRQEIDEGDVEGSSWGKQEGSFYSHKVFIVVDVPIEQPILIRMETGSGRARRCSSRRSRSMRSDTTLMLSKPVLADAAYDSADNREACNDGLGCRLLHPINPRKSTGLKAIK